MRSNPKGYPNKRRQNQHRINESIIEPEVRLVGEKFENQIISTAQALNMAKNEELDLVEISKSKNIPICKIIDYNKFLYEKKKKEKELKVKNKIIDTKEIRFTPGTEKHDFEFKSKYVEKFLKDGHKVRVLLIFRRRTVYSHKERGELLIYKLAEKVAAYGNLESNPKMEGRRMIALLIPKN